jgi:hypothetical protein
MFVFVFSSLPFPSPLCHYLFHSSFHKSTCGCLFLQMVLCILCSSHCLSCMHQLIPVSSFFARNLFSFPSFICSLLFCLSNYGWWLAEGALNAGTVIQACISKTESKGYVWDKPDCVSAICLWNNLLFITILLCSYSVSYCLGVIWHC